MSPPSLLSLLLLLSACARAPTPPEPAPTTPAAGTPEGPIEEPLPEAYHQAAEAAAAARVPDPARGGPPVHPSASPLPPFRGADRSAATYVGAASCASCHPAEAAIWRESAHASARDTLVAVDKGYNPTCLRCHVTGMMHPGGFAGMKETPQLAHVGCEACHGPGSEHVVDGAVGYGDLPEGPEACVGCHAHDNSPDFRWDGYWGLVVHGG